MGTFSFEISANDNALDEMMIVNNLLLQRLNYHLGPSATDPPGGATRRSGDEEALVLLDVIAALADRGSPILPEPGIDRERVRALFERQLAAADTWEDPQASDNEEIRACRKEELRLLQKSIESVIAENEE